MSTRLEELLELLKTEPGDSFLKYALALEYQNAGDKEKALDVFEELKKSAPEYLPLYYPLGLLYEQKGELKKATDIYEEGRAVAVKKGDRHHEDFLRRSLDFLFSKLKHG